MATRLVSSAITFWLNGTKRVLSGPVAADTTLLDFLRSPGTPPLVPAPLLSDGSSQRLA